MVEDPLEHPPVAQDSAGVLEGWPDDPEIDPYGSRMLARFGWPLRVIARLFFEKIDDESCDVEPVKRAAKDGSIVYVMRTRSRLDYLYFNHFVLKKGLPLARFANGVRTTAAGPLGQALRRLMARFRWRRRSRRRLPDPVDSGYLGDLARRGDPTLVFLRHGRTGLFHPKASARDLVEVLVEAQQQRSEPIFLVPQILIWERQPDRTNRGLVDVMLGDSDDPGWLRKGLIFLLYHRRAIVRLGEPVNLAEFIEAQEGQPVARIAKKLRWLLLGYLYRERKVIKGPDVRPRRWIFDRILAEPAVKTAITAEMVRQGRSEVAITRRARKILDKMGADYRWGAVMALRTALDYISKRLYSGVQFDAEDAERIRKAARKGTVLLLPAHRSHFDYLLLSWLLFYQGMMPPHIAAGANLAFFPMGPIFRRSGAFFIRRATQGDDLYATLLNHYLRALTAEGYTQEFFIEGGRSRSGKMLPPKVGLLGSYVEAMADRIVPDIQIVPVYIAYERVVEDYSVELTGEEKQAETASALVRSSKVLRKRFGRVYVKTNEPISLKEALETLDSPWQSLEPDERKVWLKRFGQHIVAEIQDVTVVTPSTVAAMALLAHDRRGITREHFHKRCRFLRQWLEGRGAPFSDSWHFPEDALDETLELFAAEKWVSILGRPAGHDEGEDDIVAIAQEAGPRIQMDFSKNTILFHFAPAAFVCTALALSDGEPTPMERLAKRFDYLVDLFGAEFFFHPDMPTAFVMATVIDQLAEHGVVVVEGDSVRVGDWARARLMIATVRNFFEAYYVVLKGSRMLRSGPMTEKELVAAALEYGRRLFLTEDVTRAEAIGKVNLTNAVRHFKGKGVLIPVGDHHGGTGQLELDEDARERYMGPMRKLFHSDKARPDLRRDDR